MRYKPQFVILLTLMVLSSSCNSGQWTLTSPPPPGWRSPVSDLFVDETAFPEGWRIEFPEDIITDPTINHVGISWGRPDVAGTVYQVIWRAYTIEDAMEEYAKISQQPLLRPHYTPAPKNFYVEFRPPPEVDFQSQVADESYLACGWLEWAFCEIVARYHNYVVYMNLDLAAEYGGHTSSGLTYVEIEKVMRAMDAKFAEAITEWYAETQ